MFWLSDLDSNQGPADQQFGFLGNEPPARRLNWVCRPLTRSKQLFVASHWR